MLFFLKIVLREMHSYLQTELLCLNKKKWKPGRRSKRRKGEQMKLWNSNRKTMWGHNKKWTNSKVNQWGTPWLDKKYQIWNNKGTKKRQKFLKLYWCTRRRRQSKPSSLVNKINKDISNTCINRHRKMT